MSARVLLQPPVNQHRQRQFTSEDTPVLKFSWNPQTHGSRRRKSTYIVTATSSFDTALPPIPTDFPPLPSPKLPPFRKITLPNNLRILLLRDEEIGTVRGQLLIKAGSRLEQANQLGIASIAAAVQRNGGTASLPQGMLDDALESRAASIEVGSSVSLFSASFRCLPEDVKFVLPLFRDVALDPLLPPSSIEFCRSQLLGSIARRNDNPGSIAAREMQQLLYGRESIFARVPTAETVQSLTRQDIVDFCKLSTCCPKDAVLAIWGSFDVDRMAKKAQKVFADWGNNPAGRRAGGARFPPIAEEGYAAREPGVYLVDKPGLTQGYIRMGELGTTIRDSSVFPLDVLNSILNGFGGRLFDQVRSQEGLAYSVSGGWSPGIDHRGSFVAGGETQAQSVGRFISAVQKVLKEAQEQPPTQDELNRAKKSSLNSFIFNFADSGSQLNRIATYDLFGISQDFLFEYQKRVEATTARDVLAVAQKFLHVPQQPILVVADAQTVRGQIEDMGLPITTITPS